jgi:hypothetical protein
MVCATKRELTLRAGVRMIPAFTRPVEIWPAVTEDTVAVAALTNPIGDITATEPATVADEASMEETARVAVVNVLERVSVFAVTEVTARLPAVTAALPSATVVTGAEIVPVTTRLPTVAEPAASTTPLLM